jgi:hypothetical protein
VKSKKTNVELLRQRIKSKADTTFIEEQFIRIGGKQVTVQVKIPASRIAIHTG